ncbi:MAG: RibD family protein [Pseudanabaenaceae cyanobacterium SKYGB_i_bin29]|nr:RibD family protein [Pseudanabaenaceae cyanobacterium SKYG29]MDW8422271.1 RibD family protein [Pseudanabaenaceae cyanobacterium SKYGB_i_bin29]
MTSTADVYSQLELVFPQANRIRPYVIFNMIASVDGRGGVKFSSATDRRVMAQLRAAVDAVVWGGGTIRSDPIALRLPNDLAHRSPIAVIWTRSGMLPLEHPLWHNQRSERLIFTMTRATNLAGIPAQIHQVNCLTEMLFILWQSYGIKTLLVEGGATLNYLLLSADIGEELFLTLAPVLSGDNSPTILQGGLVRGIKLECCSVKQINNEIYLRYRIKWGESP